MAHLRIDRVLGFEHGVPPALGAAIAGIGLLFLLLGWRLHRFSAAAFGFALGAVLGQLVARWIQVDRMWGVMVGGASFALLSGPVYRVTVFLLAGLAVGAGAGELVRLAAPGGFSWGFVPGFVFGGVLSLWQLRPLVILATALLGAAALWWGGAAAIGAWLLRPAATFHARHPVATAVIVGLLFLIGCAVQIRFSPRRHDEED